MTREDIENLWKLLEVFRPNDRRLKDKRLKSAWLAVLEPYKPEDVKTAVIEYFRTSGYWPDVSDISMRCQQPASRSSEYKPSRAEQAAGRAIDRAAEIWRASLEALGLRNPSDGQTYTEWAEAVEMAGLRIEDCIRAAKEAESGAKAV
ncbi:hypothetical protein [Candidatus Allofournierella merdipullorum]|uniref:hypothetical protein n=1 Tax=Candidatus Allofournierella merdipullorum TaxID=2838595 RepID=UPI00374FCF1B